MKFFKEKLPSIIIATICLTLFGSWYLNFNVNKRVVLTSTPYVYVERSAEKEEEEKEEEIEEKREEESKEEQEIPLGKININTADERVLMSLPGIGEKIAADIVLYREENGDFKQIEDIMNVKRIGEKTFAGFKDLISVE